MEKTFWFVSGFISSAPFNILIEVEAPIFNLNVLEAELDSKGNGKAVVVNFIELTESQYKHCTTILDDRFLISAKVKTEQ